MSNNKVPTVKLNTGAEIPIIGMGSYAPITDAAAQAKVGEAVTSAIQNGVRHLDTAHIYGTEAQVGEAIRKSGLKREEVWVTTKLPMGHMDRVSWSFERSLKNLGLEYVDLYLMHWPIAFEYDENEWFPKNPDGTWKLNESTSFTAAWAEMEKLLETGRVKAIGVSNFSIKNLEILLQTAKVVPAINQVELHPYFSQEPLRAFCASKGIVLEAFTPTGWNTAPVDPLILSLAEKYKASPVQIINAWHVARGVVILPTSSKSERQKENLTIITLEREDVDAISNLDRNQRLHRPGEDGSFMGWSAERMGWD